MKLQPRILAVVVSLGCLAARGEVVFQTDHYRAVLGDDARWQSLTLTGSSRELLDTAARLPAATVTVNGQAHRAQGVKAADGRLRWTFDQVDTELVYSLERAPDWTVLRLLEIHGTRPSDLVFLQVPTKVGGHLGRRLNVAWDEESAVCLLAADRRTDCHAAGRPAGVLLAQSQDAPGPTLEGNAAALLACPTSDLRGVLQRASHAFGLLTNESPEGVPSKDAEATRGSYWFIGQIGRASCRERV